MKREFGHRPVNNPIECIRARMPNTWRVTAVNIGGKALAVDDRATVDLSGQQGIVSVQFSVRK